MWPGRLPAKGLARVSRKKQNKTLHFYSPLVNALEAKSNYDIVLNVAAPRRRTNNSTCHAATPRTTTTTTTTATQCKCNSQRNATQCKLNAMQRNQETLLVTPRGKNKYDSIPIRHAATPGGRTNTIIFYSSCDNAGGAKYVSQHGHQNSGFLAIYVV